MPRTEKNKYALGSTVTDGLLCVDGHEHTVTTEFDKGENFEGLVKLFDNYEEAKDYAVNNEYYALQPIIFNHS